MPILLPLLWLDSGLRGMLPCPSDPGAETMADEQSLVVLCGKCRVSPEVATDAQGQSSATCPVCGQQDEIGDVRREVLAQAFHETIRKGIGPDIKSSGKGFINISVQGPAKREFRWIVGE